MSTMNEVNDQLGRAWRRERRHRWWLRGYSPHILAVDLRFTCVVCRKARRDDERREFYSEVCVHCARLAGFDE